MANTRYRRGGAYAADMAVYARAMAADNSAQLSRVKRNLVRARGEARLRRCLRYGAEAFLNAAAEGPP